MVALLLMTQAIAGGFLKDNPGPVAEEFRRRVHEMGEKADFAQHAWFDPYTAKVVLDAGPMKELANGAYTWTQAFAVGTVPGAAPGTGYNVIPQAPRKFKEGAGWATPYLNANHLHAESRAECQSALLANSYAVCALSYAQHNGEHGSYWVPARLYVFTVLHGRQKHPVLTHHDLMLEARSDPSRDPTPSGVDPLGTLHKLDQDHGFRGTSFGTALDAPPFEGCVVGSGEVAWRCLTTFADRPAKVEYRTSKSLFAAAHMTVDVPSTECREVVQSVLRTAWGKSWEELVYTGTQSGYFVDLSPQRWMGRRARAELTWGEGGCALTIESVVVGQDWKKSSGSEHVDDL